MVEQTDSKRAVAAYVPFKTFRTAIETLGQGMPSKLDRSAWPSFSGITQSETLTAFKFLGLVDADGFVQPILRELAVEKEESEAYKAALGTILQSRYPDVVKAAKDNATISQLQEVMRGHGVSGTTLDKAIRFWTEAAKFTGIPYPATWAKARGAVARSIRRRRGNSVTDGVGGNGNGEGGQPDEKLGSTRLPGDLNEIVAALIKDLAAKGANWAEAERTVWKKTFDTIFDYAYPAKDPQASAEAKETADSPRPGVGAG